MKKVHVVVKSRNKKGPGVQLGIDGSLIVCVRELPEDGKANKAVIEALAKYYDIPKSLVELKSGATSKYKVFLIGSPL